MSEEIRNQIDKVKKISQSLVENQQPERTSYDGHSIGDIIISDGSEPYTGGNVPPRKGREYQLVQKNLSDFDSDVYNRGTVYSNEGLQYKDEEDHRLNNMKKDFINTPPIPEEDDGLHRIVVAKELGNKTILMWKLLPKNN